MFGTTDSELAGIQREAERHTEFQLLVFVAILAPALDLAVVPFGP
jgi:hypothetical protein